MIPFTLDEIGGVTGGRLVDGDPTATVTGVAVDSREVRPGDLFVALPGSRTDGSLFAVAAAQAGAVATMAPAGMVFAGPRVEVADPLAALAALGTAVRDRSAATVVAVTGSNGKTTTKDLLAAALATRLRTVANRASFNNEVGLPLTLARIEPDTQAVVVEMGARGPGHIAALARLARPGVGVVLNVGESHLGMFGSRGAIAKAKAELVEALPADGTAVLNADDPQVAAMADRTVAQAILFGLGPTATVRADGVELDGDGAARFLLTTPAGTAPTVLPAPGEHLVGCALAAAAVAHVLGVGPTDAAAGLAGAKLSPMRMQVLRRPDGLTIVNDAYNANPSSMAAALKTLAALGRPGGRTVAVLGEMAELGPSAADEHDRIGRLATRLGIDRLVGVGELGRVLVNAARMEGMWPEEAEAVTDPEAAVALLTPTLGPVDVVLVKASRVVALDMVADALLQPRGA
ncbi:MAG TPA: UDP-N-acetylmuramoyl-tripeptide--D-alanyl-D-alanine ligase [Actinomycetes bacterium]|nr:UDP-N-acetylmuramoyl-tripeptide--D-alanyl-D-alanine ligase [Actinomycetes bacterium]